ncbi:exonuclease V subunit alpha [Labrenzia sp. THAF82]|uniref:ATP-binding domain-containing protein n=1 Tax=Labrenzia sp. THAF82 TaxID=2587861 RepID=UPI0012A9BB36|nr:exonuclease V subunit alpha [Labrenzia sp. THAF82]
MDWQRQVSVAFATQKTGEALAAYRDNGSVHLEQGGEAARSAVVRDYLADMDGNPQASRVVLAHRRADVKALNEAIRSTLQEWGALTKGAEAGEVVAETNDGTRSFASGDRIVFLENNRELGVKNGMLGTVERIETSGDNLAPRLVARLDGENGRSVQVDLDTYKAIDHGYATTIHKSQGATVDRAFVLASSTMDRHLTYVAMTRHRKDVQLYADASAFAGRSASHASGQSSGHTSGRLVAHGAAPFEHKQGNAKSYFVTLETAQGAQHTTWGVDLERALGEARPKIGDMIGLRREGSQSVRLPDGRTVERNAWAVQSGEELAYDKLAEQLSRSGAKETTLDYTAAFAERRGIASTLGINSEIEVKGLEGGLAARHDNAPEKRVFSMDNGSIDEHWGGSVEENDRKKETGLDRGLEKPIEQTSPLVGRQQAPTGAVAGGRSQETQGQDTARAAGSDDQWAAPSDKWKAKAQEWRAKAQALRDQRQHEDGEPQLSARDSIRDRRLEIESRSDNQEQAMWAIAERATLHKTAQTGREKEMQYKLEAKARIYPQVWQQVSSQLAAGEHTQHLAQAVDKSIAAARDTDIER